MSTYGVSLNSVHSSTLNLTMKTIKRPLLSAPNDTYLTINDRAGSWLKPGKPQDKIITLQFEVSSDTFLNLKVLGRQIAAWLYSSDIITIVFDDEPQLTQYGKVSSEVDFETFYITGKFIVSLRCSPYTIGQTTIPSTPTSFTNEGTATALPIFTVIFTLAGASDYKVTNLLDGKFVLITYDFELDDELIINCENNLVTINGSRAMNAYDLSSSFFELPVGSNSLSFSTTGGAANTQLSFQERWL